MSFFYIIHIVVCVLLILVILFQDGKTGGLVSVADTGNNAFGGAGASSFLTKLTSGIAIVFMCTSVFLAFLNAPGDSSIADDYTPPAQTNSTTMAPQPGDAAGQANPNAAAVDADGNPITLDQAVGDGNIEAFGGPGGDLSQVPDEILTPAERARKKAAAEAKKKAEEAGKKKEEKPKTEESEKKDQ